MKKLPKLPEPTIVDGRQLYTAGQLREYGAACFELGENYIPEYEPQPKSDYADYADFGDIFSGLLNKNKK